MNSDDLFLDVEYVDNIHKYQKKVEKPKLSVNQNVYQSKVYVPEKTTEIKPDKTPDLLSKELNSLKKNIITELEIGILFTILIFSALMTSYQIFKLNFVKHLLPWFLIALVLILVLYLIIVMHRISKVKKVFNKTLGN